MKKSTTVLVAIAAACVAPGVFAQATATIGYVSVSAGPSHISVDCSGTSSCDDNGTAARVLFGYKIIPNVAIEASFASLGKVKATVPVDGDSINASIKGQAIGVGVAALLPFGSNNAWTAIGRLGVASVRTTVGASSGSVSANDSETKAQTYVGLGLNYAFTQNLELGVAIDTTQIQYDGDKSTVRSYNVVGTFKF